MDVASSMDLSKAASFHSARRGSINTPSHHPSESRKSVAHTTASRAALLQALNNNNNNTDFDRASETSSMEERRYAELLGPDRDYDSYLEFGNVHEPQNVGHRLYICGVAQQKAREDRLRAKRERIILKELNELTTKPSITNHARLKPAKGPMFADHSEEWRQRREERLADLSFKVRAEREKELTASPHINRRSAEIAESSGYRGPVSGWEDHFAKYYAKKSCAALQAPPPGMFTPNVNHSYRNKRNADDSMASTTTLDVTTRLYDDASIREEKQLELREREEEKALRDPYTNRPYFTPSRVDYNIGRPDQTPEEAGARLHSLHEEQERRLKAKTEEHIRRVEESKFKPVLNPRSVEIGENRRRPLYEKKDVSETLASNRSRAPRSGGANPNNSTSSNLSNKKISASNVQDFLNRTERSTLMRQQRLERIRHQAHNREAVECTFKPAVNRKSMEMFFEIHQYGADLVEHTSNRRQKMGGGGNNASYGDATSYTTGTNQNTPRTGGGGSPRYNLTNAHYGGGGHNMSPSASPITTGRGNQSSTSQYHRDPMSGMAGGGGHDPRSSHMNSSSNNTYHLQHANNSAGRAGVGIREHSPTNNTTNGGAPSHIQSDFAQQFEQQMFEVLDEWRRLEDV